MTDAYHKPDGTIVPSTGIWGLRELAKRTFQYENERGMLPVTMAHMTSTSILPMLPLPPCSMTGNGTTPRAMFRIAFPRDISS